MINRVLTLLWLAVALVQSSNAADPVHRKQMGPSAGDVYREIACDGIRSDKDWRVTDPEATASGARNFLPNPVRTLHVPSLQGVTRAEVEIDRWGGHLGTTNKRIRFNDGAWLHLPEPAFASPERAVHFYYQDNLVVEVPLDDLRAGANTFEGTCDAVPEQNWGQWGLYAMTLRLYYDSETENAPEVEITAPLPGAVIQDNPPVEVRAAGGAGVSRIDVFAYYEGYDVDGDGHTREWQEARFKRSRAEPMQLSGHVGTVSHMPYHLVWDTSWFPDQPEKSIGLVARVMDSQGLWRVSAPVEGLTLSRPDTSVTLYQASIPEACGVRMGQVQRCKLALPEQLDRRNLLDAKLALRTWHGWDEHHEPLALNGNEFAIHGREHFYDFDLLPIDSRWLQPGDNELVFRSDTSEHMLEVLAPGPALLIRSKR